jgi:ribosomal protein S18 acetylase RimI-like enzyme
VAEGRPIGAAWLRRLTGANRGFGSLDDETPELSIAVLPDHRGKGVGTRLLTDLLETARARYLSVCLSVSAGNPARRLYERVGFVAVGEASGSLTMRQMSR